MNKHTNFLTEYIYKADIGQLGTYNVNIGKLGITVRSAEDELSVTAKKKYEEFLVEESYDTQVTIFNMNGIDNTEEIQDAFSDYSDLMTNADDHIFTVYRWDFFGVIDLNKLSARFIYFYNTFMSYESIIRIFYSILTVKNNGFLMHSSSLVHNNKGYLFFGVSGSGKSTVVKLSEPDTCLSDELSMLIKIDGTYIVCGTPFHGEIPLYTNKQATLQNAFLLRQNTTTFFEKLESVDAYTHIMRNILFFSDDWGLKQEIFKTTIDLVNSVGVYEMNFEKNNKFWEIIDHGFNEEDKEK